MSLGVWLSFLGVIYALGIPVAGRRIAAEVNDGLRAWQIHLPSQRSFRLMVGIFALGWPAVALYWIAVKIVVAYSNAKGIDDEPPDASNGAT